MADDHVSLRPKRVACAAFSTPAHPFRHELVDGGHDSLETIRCAEPIPATGGAIRVDEGDSALVAAALLR